MTYVGERARLAPAVVLFACLFAAQAAILVLSPILPQVAADFRVSLAAAAQLRAVSGVTAGVAALILATTGDRYRLTYLLNSGLLLLAMGSLGSAASPTFVLLVVAQVVIGLGLALVLSGGLAASEAWAAGGTSARVLSWALVGQPVAWVVGQPLAGLVAAYHWRWAWVAVPFASSLVALATVAWRDRATPDGGRECDPLGLWKLPGVKGWALGELLAFSAWAGMLVYAGAFFIETYGASVRLTGLVLGMGAVAYLPGNFLGRRWLRGGPPPLLVVFALAAAGTVAVLGGVRAGLLFSAIAFAVLAFFAAGRTIAGAALGLGLAKGRRLAAMSLRTATMQFGYMLGASIGGAILARWGFAGMGWGFAVLFIAAAAAHIPGALRGRTSAHITALAHLRRS